MRINFDEQVNELHKLANWLFNRYSIYLAGQQKVVIDDYDYAWAVINAEKTRENRLRRMARRQGLDLQKSRRRDPRALDYGGYQLIARGSNSLVLGELAGNGLVPAWTILRPSCYGLARIATLLAR